MSETVDIGSHWTCALPALHLFQTPQHLRLYSLTVEGEKLHFHRLPPSMTPPPTAVWEVILERRDGQKVQTEQLPTTPHPGDQRPETSLILWVHLEARLINDCKRSLDLQAV